MPFFGMPFLAWLSQSPVNQLKVRRKPCGKIEIMGGHKKS